MPYHKIRATEIGQRLLRSVGEVLGVELVLGLRKLSELFMVHDQGEYCP